MSSCSVGNLIQYGMIWLSASTVIWIVLDIDDWHIQDKKSWLVRLSYDPEARKFKVAKT